jgi:plasmid maintenance system killer protein
MPIQSFKDKDAEALHATGKSSLYGNTAEVALRKLDMLGAANLTVS